MNLINIEAIKTIIKTFTIFIVFGNLFCNIFYNICNAEDINVSDAMQQKLILWDHLNGNQKKETLQKMINDRLHLSSDNNNNNKFQQKVSPQVKKELKILAEKKQILYQQLSMEARKALMEKRKQTMKNFYEYEYVGNKSIRINQSKDLDYNKN